MKELIFIASATAAMAIMFCSGCQDTGGSKDHSAVADQAIAAGKIPQIPGDTVTTASGLKYLEIRTGTGAAPKTGQTCVMHYSGWLTDGTKFDASRDRGQPFPFPLGQGRVIRGWDEGVASMKIGGRRILVIPPQLGYGERGAGGVIPPNATLVFEIELLEVR
jgi:peptidylprolyl isomerase